MSDRLYAFERNRLSVSAFGKWQGCAAGYILSTHYMLIDDMMSDALRNGIKVHAEFEDRHVIHGYKVIAHEVKIEVDNPTIGRWMGYIDAECVDDDGAPFVVDIKTSKRAATPSWAQGYLLSLQAALYTVAKGVETFAIYHPTDRKMYMTQLNPSASKARLLKAFNQFMGWQAGGQRFKCDRSWGCKWCDFDGHCEHLMNNPGCKLPPTLQLKISSR